MNTNFKVIGLTRLGIAPQFYRSRSRRSTPLGHLNGLNELNVDMQYYILLPFIYVAAICVKLLQFIYIAAIWVKLLQFIYIAKKHLNRLLIAMVIC